MLETVALAKGVEIAEKAQKAISGIAAIYETNRNNKIKKDEKLDNACKVIMKALSYTRFYLRKFNEGVKDQEKEFELMLLWSAAGAAIREFSPSLSADFMFKSDYWADPDNPESKKKARKLDKFEKGLFKKRPKFV